MGEPLAPVVLGWSAWAPGLETRDAWRAWASDAQPIAGEGHPEADFLPPMLRRRCKPLTRILLTAAFGCGDVADLSDVRTVFATRHGSINDSVRLFADVAAGNPLSPAVFSHTVHNVQAGLFSMAAKNRRASSSISAQGDTFASAWIEALTQLDREPAGAVLLVVGDVPLEPPFAVLLEEPRIPHGVAFVLGAEGPGPRLAYAPGRRDAAPPAAPWPDALVFLRWLLGDAHGLSLGSGVSEHRWSRVVPDPGLGGRPAGPLPSLPEDPGD